MKKLLASLLAVTLLLAACGNKDEEKTETKAPTTEITEAVKIQFWHPFTGAIEAELTRLTEEFNNESEFITVELVYQGKYNDLETKLLNAQQSDSLPTMAVAYSTWDGLLKSFENLDAYTEVEGYELDWNDYVKSFVDEVTTKDGEIYGVPFNKSTEVLYYNKDLWAQAGLTDAPESFEELFEATATMKEKTGVVGVGFDSLSGYLATSLTGNKLPWYKDGEFQFADENIVSNVNLYNDAIKAGHARTAGEDNYMSGPFGSGSVAMYAGSTAGKQFVASAVDGKFEWGAMPYPNNTAIQQGTNLVVFSSASETEKMAAWQFINFLGQEKNATDFAIATGYVPVTYAALESDVYQEFIKTDEVAKASYEQTEKMSAGEPVDSGAGQIYREMQVTMSSILDTGEDVVKALEALCELSETIYGRAE